MKYNIGNAIFDCNNSFYTAIKEKNSKIDEEFSGNVSENFDEKYSALIEAFTKICVTMNSALEKYDTTAVDE